MISRSIGQMGGITSTQLSRMTELPKPVPVQLNQQVRTYQLRPQETILDVAIAHDIKLATLLKLNDIDLSNPPAPGVVLRLE